MKKWIYAIIFLLSTVNIAFCDDYQAILCQPEKIVIDKDLYNIEIEPIRIPYGEGWVSAAA